MTYTDGLSLFVCHKLHLELVCVDSYFCSDVDIAFVSQWPLRNKEQSCNPRLSTIMDKEQK